MLLNATSPAQYSVSPLASSFHTIDHGDAAGQADEDQPRHVLGLVAQEDGSQWQTSGLAPRSSSAPATAPAPSSRGTRRPVPHSVTLARGGYIIRYQPQGNRDAGGFAEFQIVDQRAQAWGNTSQDDADDHRYEDPQRQETIKEEESRLATPSLMPTPHSLAILPNTDAKKRRHCCRPTLLLAPTDLAAVWRCTR